MQDIEVGTEDLDGDLALDAGQGFLDVVLDDLGEIGRQARQNRELFLHVGHQRILGGETPCVARLQVGEDLHVVRALGVGAVIGTPYLGNDPLHFRIAAQGSAHHPFHILGVFERRAWRQGDGQPQVAFVQLGKEFAAEHRRQGEGQGDDGAGDAECEARVATNAAEQAAVGALQADQPVDMFFRQVAPAEHDRQQGGNQRESEQHGAQQGK